MGERTDGFSIKKDEKVPAKKAYEVGAVHVREKTKKALDMYNELMTYFSSYGNRCLEDTIIKGMPEFFKWYNIDFGLL